MNHHCRLINPAFASVLFALLSACGGSGGGGDSASGGGSSGGGSGGPCVVANIAGEPDMPSAPSFTPAAIARGGTATVNIPIDADTQYVAVNLFTADRSNYAGGGLYQVPTPGAQTVSIAVTTAMGVATGQYFALINLCSTTGACFVGPTSTVPGIAVAYTTDALTAPGPNYARTKYYENQNITGAATALCTPVPYLSIS